MGTKITFRRPDGKEAAGYLAKAGRANAPGIVVIQEWWGLQGHLRSLRTRRLRGAGAGPLRRHRRSLPRQGRGWTRDELAQLPRRDGPDRSRGRLLLNKASVKVGLTGFCMGGALTILGACRIPEISAAVCFYGLPPEAVAKPADVKVPLQAHFANKDDWCTPQAVDKFEAGLKAAGKSAEVFRYDAEHGFVNEQRDVHDRTAAELAWERTLSFWATHLDGQ